MHKIPDEPRHRHPDILLLPDRDFNIPSARGTGSSTLHVFPQVGDRPACTYRRVVRFRVAFQPAREGRSLDRGRDD